MRTSQPGRAVLGGLCAVLMVLTLTAAGAEAVATGPTAAAGSPPTAEAHHCSFWAAG